MNNGKICIMTTFSSNDSAYSLNRVVQDQIKMLVAFGYTAKVIVEKGFIPQDAYSLPGVELVYLPDIPKSNEGILPDNYKEVVDNLATLLEEALKDVSVVIGHDIISQPAHLIHNLAARKVAEKRSDLRWLHWIHSVFSSNVASNIMEVSKVGREKFPNSFIVFPNSYDIPRIAKNFQCEETDVKWCPHPTDIEGFFNMNEVSRKFIQANDLLEQEIVMVYPCRLDRGKQPHFVVELIGALKRLGTKAKCVIMDFHSTAGDKVTYRDEMKKQAEELGVKDNVLFFSEFDEKYKYEAPQQIVKDLMMISNVFMMPSVSETYSLVAQEAILCGNFVILNQDFPPFRSIFGDLPKYYQFSGNIGMNGMDGQITTNYGNKKAYFEDIAKYCNYMVRFDKVLALKTKIRMTRNLYSVFKEFFEPLLGAK